MHVVKELVHGFSWVYIELRMHLGSLENTLEARVALGSAFSNFTFLLCSHASKPLYTVHPISMKRFSYCIQVNPPTLLFSNQSGYEPLNLENCSFLNSDNFNATDLRF